MNLATITLKFNDMLRNDQDGKFSVFDFEHFNTENAKLLKEGSTYQVSSISFSIPVPKEGKEFVFAAMGLYTACYVKNEKEIFPGDNEVWLIANQEFLYSYYDI